MPQKEQEGLWQSASADFLGDPFLLWADAHRNVKFYVLHIGEKNIGNLAPRSNIQSFHMIKSSMSCSVGCCAGNSGRSCLGKRLISLLKKRQRVSSPVPQRARHAGKHIRPSTVSDTYICTYKFGLQKSTKAQFNSFHFLRGWSFQGFFCQWSTFQRPPVGFCVFLQYII